MGERNIPYGTPFVDTEMDQQARLHPEPCVPYGSITSFPPPNIQAVLAPPGNRILEHHGTLPYGVTQYRGLEHHHPPAFLTNHGSFEVPESFGVNAHFMNGVGALFKRKTSEGNFQYFYPSASSIVVPMSARPVQSDISAMESATHFAVPDYRVNDVSHIRNRPGLMGNETVLVHNNNHLFQGNYIVQPLQAVGTPWLDQRFSNGGDAGAYTWSHVPGVPYLQGGVDAARMGVQGYPVAVSNRISTTSVHPSIAPQGHHNLHHRLPPPPVMQGMRNPNMELYSQAPTMPHRLSTQSSFNVAIPFRGGVELGPRFLAPNPQNGVTIYRPQRRETMPNSPARQSSLPHLRVLPEDGVAILDVSEYQVGGNPVDHHRDMRMDIDHMSYEELLALGEQIGSVGSGLSEDFILNHLKTRAFISSTLCSHLEEGPCIDQELNVCVICQNGYSENENIGTLDCGHEYHVDCINKWLIMKNTCPVCKSSALAVGADSVRTDE